MAKLHSHELKPFKADHMIGVHWTEEKLAALLGDRAFVTYEKHPGYSLFCGGSFVAAAGIIKLYQGVGEAWAIAGRPLSRPHVLAFHRNIARIMDGLARDMKLRRLQAMVRESFAQSHLWVERLGFERESVLRRYGINGEDMTMYTRFFDAD